MRAKQIDANYREPRLAKGDSTRKMDNHKANKCKDPLNRMIFEAK